MKIHITKGGKIFLFIVAIGLGIFFACGGWAIVSKMIENYRVNSIDGSIGSNFSKNDITFNDMNSLRQSYRTRYKHITRTIRTMQQLKQDYPENQLLEQRLKTYTNYLQSMEKASFDCPEHINTGTERRSRSCGNCGGDGKVYVFFRCGSCGGNGSISYSVTVSKNCPNCNTIHKSQITGKSLLN